MPFGSRLQVRRVQKTVSVAVKTLTAGKHVESNAYTGLTPTHEQMSASELSSDIGLTVPVVDVFWFERLTATNALPVIEEKHILTDSGSQDYEVIEVSNEGGQGNRLKVITRRLR